MKEKVTRPWGHYVVTNQDEKTLTKIIHVNPQSRLSTQFHRHRKEYWTILEGIATVLKGETEITLTKGESIHIDIKEIHALKNSTKAPLKIIEIQEGEHLCESDITRIDDQYGRT